mmetsp:Transcript_44565/g.140617  ORF Transcript_44565/g.140617 Transcript_44565/m.140617 type:complete len:111 (-) Transcript_44565:2717-3049(-)
MGAESEVLLLSSLSVTGGILSMFRLHSKRLLPSVGLFALITSAHAVSSSFAPSLQSRRLSCLMHAKRLSALVASPQRHCPTTVSALHLRGGAADMSAAKRIVVDIVSDTI